MTDEPTNTKFHVVRKNSVTNTLRAFVNIPAEIRDNLLEERGWNHKKKLWVYLPQDTRKDYFIVFGSLDAYQKYRRKEGRK